MGQSVDFFMINWRKGISSANPRKFDTCIDGAILNSHKNAISANKKHLLRLGSKRNEQWKIIFINKKIERKKYIT